MLDKEIKKKLNLEDFYSHIPTLKKLEQTQSLRNLWMLQNYLIFRYFKQLIHSTV